MWTDHASGALDRRPQLDDVLEQLRPGDTLVVWRLDRLGRSLRHLIDIVTGLDERGVGFRSLRENIDTTTAGGGLVFHLFGALAQFEREIIRDRTVAGLTAARARGRIGGRPSKLSAEQRRQARKLYDERELTVQQIGRVLGVSRTSTYRGPRRRGCGDRRHVGAAVGTSCRRRPGGAALASPPAGAVMKRAAAGAGQLSLLELCLDERDPAVLAFALRHQSRRDLGDLAQRELGGHPDQVLPTAVGHARAAQGRSTPTRSSSHTCGRCVTGDGVDSRGRYLLVIRLPGTWLWD